MPQTIIYHVDVNSAFLSWQSCHNLETAGMDLRTIPAVIGGDEEKRHGIVLAKSIPAKKYGIRTAETLASARVKCPDLVVSPPDFSVYIEYSSRFIELLKQHSPTVEQVSVDEAYCDMTGMELLHGDPVEYAHTLRRDIRDTLGFTVNIGVSTNKLLAKMASDFEKPDKVHTLFLEEIEKKLWPLPVDELFSVGKSTAKKLHGMGVHTIGELAAMDKKLLRSHFKKHGEIIWEYANGIASDVLEGVPSPSKGYGNSMTLPADVTDRETARKILLSLCETVGERIRRDKVYVSVVSVTMVDNEFVHRSRQMTLPSTTCVTEQIYDCACRLFEEGWNHKPLRLLGVSTSHASAQHYEQYDLFEQNRYEQLSKLNMAIDKIRGKYGNDAVKRACFLGEEQRQKGLYQKKK